MQIQSSEKKVLDVERFQTYQSNRDIVLPKGSKDEPLWIAVQDFLLPLLQPHVILWLASVSLKLKPLQCPSYINLGPKHDQNRAECT